MAKLGYTWYPKDWGNSEAVFELTLLERGLYRELIDMAMLNDNKTIINIKTWSRKFGASIEDINTILKTLEGLGLVQIDFDGSNHLFIPSCEPRLKLVRGGSKGGSKSKPNPKPLGKPDSKPNQKPNPKPDSNQREKKLNEIENKKKSFNVFWNKYPKKVAKSDCEKKFLKLKQTEIEIILDTLDNFLLYKPFEDYNHPNPTTYLNQKRWNDELPEPKKVKKTWSVANHLKELNK